ncbi:hypothetical protein KUH03_03645 [Sphingobacterium sp. E70]|uniref:hypothetical protein n=1 Tax=Sphingobacterium sp. E70 TaxID=2853439 RepID=UPI00211BB1A7|nr:hypothetical protein [Sphingobacterium sp. E70]ULT26068.1 hypothetical protein KUH03_03645 [Sphingobacterium sp. E70]
MVLGILLLKKVHADRSAVFRTEMTIAGYTLQERRYLKKQAAPIVSRSSLFFQRYEDFIT